MEVIKGKIPGAKKVVIYGPEGIGKSTFAAQFPDPLFIDTEGSTKDMDVTRTQAPSSWEMLMEQAGYVRTHPDLCRTLVVDTIDWAEHMCVEHICAIHNKKGIEDFGYGNGYVYVKEEFGRLLNRLEEVRKTGIHIVLSAHAQLRKFEQPDELGAYDRWELKLGKKTTSQTSPLVKEWADMVLFANYRTISVAVDDKGKKHKAQGGIRVMYTVHHPCWDAKNRFGLAEELPFDYAGISHIMEQPVSGVPVSTRKEASGKEEVRQPVADVAQEQQEPDIVQEPVPQNNTSMVWESNQEHVPRALIDLMQEHNISEWDIQNVVASRGYYPADVKIEDYDKDFVSGVLIGAWQKVLGMIEEAKNNQQIPFN